MIMICDCYHEEARARYIYCIISGKPIKIETTVGVCWGTKERDECSCRGISSKCDFYSYKRGKT